MFIRIRLIPITIVFVILMLVFRIGSVWNGVDAAQIAQAEQAIPSVSEIQLAQNNNSRPLAQIQRSLASAGLIPDDAIADETTGVNYGTSNADLLAQNTNLAQATDNNLQEPENGRQITPPPAPKRLVDLADIPLRNDPNIEGLTPLTLEHGNVSDTDIIDVNSMSVAEVRLLHTLADRRRRLDSRERSLIERESVIVAAERQLLSQQDELEVIRREIRQNLQIYDDVQQEQITQMREVYSNMKAKQAAAIFNELDMDILINVLRGMTPRKIAPIIALMQVEKARDVTLRLADNTTFSIPEN